MKSRLNSSPILLALNTSNLSSTANTKGCLVVRLMHLTTGFLDLNLCCRHSIAHHETIGEARQSLPFEKKGSFVLKHLYEKRRKHLRSISTPPRCGLDHQERQ